jgi:host factor-I protein
VLLENNSQEQLIFKHAISTVVSGRAGAHVELRSEAKAEPRVGIVHPVAASSAPVPEATGTQGR